MAVFKLEVITPKGIELKEENTKFLKLKTETGDIGVLPGHAPLVTELSYGEMVIRTESNETKYFVSGGFLEINREKVTVLADELIEASQIDVERARKEAELIEAELRKSKEDRETLMMQKTLKENLTKAKIGSGL